MVALEKNASGPRRRSALPKPILRAIATVVLSDQGELDLGWGRGQGLEDIAGLLLQYGFDGVIATNTTISRDAVRGHKHESETGGLSGQPVFSPSTEILRQMNKALKGHLPIIGVGGVMSAENARQKIQAGASLIQIYTGFIYRGPQLIRDCALALK